MNSEDFIHTSGDFRRERLQKDFRGRPRNFKISGNFREASVTSISLQASYVLSEIMTPTRDQTGIIGNAFDFLPYDPLTLPAIFSSQEIFFYPVFPFHISACTPGFSFCCTGCIQLYLLSSR